MARQQCRSPPSMAAEKLPRPYNNSVAVPACGALAPEDGSTDPLALCGRLAPGGTPDAGCPPLMRPDGKADGCPNRGPLAFYAMITKTRERGKLPSR